LNIIKLFVGDKVIFMLWQPNVFLVSVTDHDVQLGIPLLTIVIGYFVIVRFMQIETGFPVIVIFPEYVFALYPDMDDIA